MPVVRLHSWRALVRLIDLGLGRLVQGLGARRMVEPRSGAAVRSVHAQRASLGETGRAKGLFRLVNRLAHAFRGNDRDGARAQHRLALRPRQRFLRGLARSRHDLFERDVRRCRPRRASRSKPAQARKLQLLLDRLDLKPGAAAARDRLRLGLARRDRRARLRRPRHRPHPVRRSRRPGPRSASPRPGLADRVAIRLDRLSRRRPARSTPSPASRWSRRSARIIGPPISRRSPAC